MPSRYPTLGVDFPAILATDSRDQIRSKIHELLAACSTAFDEKHQEALESGLAERDDYLPCAKVSVISAYVDEESAGNLIQNLQVGLAEFINALPEHGLHLCDVHEWTNTDLSAIEDGSPFGHTIGVAYQTQISPNHILPQVKNLTQKQWAEQKAKYDRGELQHNENPIEQLLQALGQR